MRGRPRDHPGVRAPRRRPARGVLPSATGATTRCARPQSCTEAEKRRPGDHATPASRWRCSSATPGCPTSSTSSRRSTAGASWSRPHAASSRRTGTTSSPTPRSCGPVWRKGKYDAYLLMPRGKRDEEFHNAITELLSDWTSTVPAARGGERQDHLADPRRAHHGASATSSTGWGCRTTSTHPDDPRPPGVHGGHPRAARRRGAPLPGRVAANRVRDPGHLGPRRRPVRSTAAPRIDADEVVDLAVVGGRSRRAGGGRVRRVGGARPSVVLEAEAIGGQAGTSSMIRNYLGFPRGISGMRLALRARNQAIRFGTRFLTGWEVTGLEPGSDGEPHVLRCDGRRGPRPGGAALHRRGLPQARRTRARGAGRQRRQLRRRHDRGPGDGGVRRRGGRRRQLRRPGRAAPLPVRGVGDHRGPAPGAGGDHVATTSSRRSATRSASTC